MDHGLLSEVIHIRLHRGKADNRVNKLKLTLKLKWDEVAKWDCIFVRDVRQQWSEMGLSQLQQ